jgi:ATP-dependent Lhr-like helicase
MSAVLDLFSPEPAAWFASAFAAPTEVQERGWAAVAAGRHTLMCAPTGSGKTLAAFLWCLDRLAREAPPPERERCRVLYISPLKALTVDIERNLRAPLRGMALEAERRGTPPPDIEVAIRSGDTPDRERRRMERHPPDILITTPESLYLILTSAAREILRPVRWVIVDEIHSLAATKRGAHLALSLERLHELAAVEPQRIGLSATQRPLEETARFLGGGREVEIIEAAPSRRLEVSVEVPVEDMADLDRDEERTERPEGPRRSIWPAIHPRLLELVRAHRSTIVFVNSRRLAERLATRLNELAGEEVARAHHGSIAKEQRLEIEEMLKAGLLPAIVATSSLELGIDMGAVDLVVQVEAPPTVAAGIQRVGRAGHSVGEISRGTVFPKHRGDLLESAVVVERMLTGDIESTRVPRNPLDVLAQQIVAMSALEEWSVDRIAALARRAHPYRDLTDRALESVLDMLAGRYPSDEFRELRPRIVWDRAKGTIRGRSGAQHLAVVSGGTIPDRGLYSVNLFDGQPAAGGPQWEKGMAMAGIAAPPGGKRPGTRVGELDEEMVYEMRVGQVFILGATSWKIVDITPSQVLVTPAPGEPGTVAFWHGDTVGRPVELGIALGALTRELREAGEKAAIKRLRERAGFDARAARNLVRYIADQAAAGEVPDDRTVVVERFRDQLGDWRVCVLTPFGARVHQPWALAVQARLAREMGVEVQAISTDDGFALRLPEADRPPETEQLLLDPEEVRDLVTAELQGSTLFASRFRENAARSLLLPRRRPDQRTPLWQQRQRSHDLLQVASGHPDFPVLLETYRECLADVFDLDALTGLMRSLRSREVRLATVDTERASPFASSLLFDYVAEYMYEGDAPLSERRAQALTLDRELLAELIGAEELRELLDPSAVADLELELQALLRERWPRNADEAADVLRRVGDLSQAEADARGLRDEWLERLATEHRAVLVRIAGEERWIAAEDAGRYRDALGVAVPRGVPEAFLVPADEPLVSLLLRWALTHVPFFSTDIARRWDLPVAMVERGLDRLIERDQLLAGAFSPRRDGRELCHPDVLRALRRRSLAVLRREIEPAPPDALGRFLPAWQGVGSSTAGQERLLEVVGQLQGYAMPVTVLERDVLPARVARYQPQMLDQLMASGEVVWAGRGAAGKTDARVALYLRSDAALLLPAPSAHVEGDVADSLREHLAARGASFFADLLAASGTSDPALVLDTLRELAWAGEVTNDTLWPLRRLSGGGRAGSRPARRPLMRLTPPGGEGRWSLLIQPAPAATLQLHALARSLLDRHGVLVRDAALAESVPGGFAALYPVLRAMEEAGRTRRGYFIDGLGGSQFALPGAVDRLRALRAPDGRVLGLSALDPANPYGATLPWPPAQGRLARVAGAYVVLDSGELRLYLERGGRSLLTLGQVGVEHFHALAEALGRMGKVEVQAVDGNPVLGSALEPVMREAGFNLSPRGLVRWPDREHALRG